MLANDEIISSPEKIISDNLTHKPSLGNSIWQNYSAGLTTAPYALNSLDKEFSESPRGKTVEATFDAIKRGNENPEVGWGQWGANEVANMVGQSMNPLTWALGEVGGLAMKPLIGVASRIAPAFTRQPISQLMKSSVGKFIPEYIGKKGEEDTLSMALLGKSWAKNFGIGAGVTLPQATIDNFNAETGKHDFLGMAKEIGGGGVFGMGISTIPFAWGILKANINRRLGRPSTLPVTTDIELRKAVEEGRLDKDSYDFWKEINQYVENTDERDVKIQALKEKATTYISLQGHPVDHANDRAQFQILSEDQLTNLQSATVDQLVADYIPEEHKNALTDFTVHAGIDDMRDNPNLLDGIRGYVEYANQELAKQDEVLTKADKLVDEHFNADHGEMPLSQHDIHKIAKEKKELPLTIPHEVSERIKQEGQIEKLEARNRKLFSDYEGTGNSTLTKEIKENGEKIEELKKNLQPLLFAKEELNHIRESILGKSKKYYRGYEKLEHNYIFDPTFGKGYWITPDIEHAKHYGSNVETVKGDFNLYDVRSRSDKELTILFKKIQESNFKQKFNKPSKKHKKLIDEFHKLAQEKGYDGLLRENQIMLFNKPSKLMKIGIKEGFKNFKEYHRLKDLADIWHPAQTLLDRVNLEEKIRQQEAYRDLAKMMLDIADQNISKQADVDKVKGYLNARVNRHVDQELEPKAEMAEVEKSYHVPSDFEEIIAEQDWMVDERAGESSKKEYEVAKEKFNEFKEREGVFKSFINCLLGAQP